MPCCESRFLFINIGWFLEVTRMFPFNKVWSRKVHLCRVTVLVSVYVCILWGGVHRLLISYFIFIKLQLYAQHAIGSLQWVQKCLCGLSRRSNVRISNVWWYCTSSGNLYLQTSSSPLICFYKSFCVCKKTMHAKKTVLQSWQPTYHIFMNCSS